MANSPDNVRMSLAAALTLNLRRGLFWRDARLYCINLLLTYDKPCAGNCAYCGLHRERRESAKHTALAQDTDRPDKTFIRVDWPTFPTELAVERTAELEEEKNLQRVCISMVTRQQSVNDTIAIIKAIREKTEIPISILASPMVTDKEALACFKDAGADRLGVAVDAATPQLFERYRGKTRNAPHRWDRYWEFFEEGISVFGENMVGSHLIVGLGESEQEMTAALQKTKNLSGETHLFSFYPEEGSDMEHILPPPIDQYRRIQIARYLIDNDISNFAKIDFDNDGKIINFGIDDTRLNDIIDSGLPFMTSGCVGKDGAYVACNRPFGNSKPGPNVRNYPFQPDSEDITRIRKQMGLD